MHLRVSSSIALLSALAGCGGIPNLEAGANTKYLSAEFGENADAIVPVPIGGQSYDFRVWVGKRHIQRITVQATPEAAALTAGGMKKLTFGYIDRPLDQTPYREAAIRYLTDTGRAGCNLTAEQQSGLDRFSWNYECTSRAPIAKTRSKSSK